MAEPQLDTTSKVAAINVRPVGDDWSAHAEPVTDSWESHAEPVHSALDTVKDVGTSLGRGVVKGTLALGGMVGDISNLVAKGSQQATNFIADKAGIDRGPQARDTFLPTNESLTKNLESVTGPLGKPETTAGKYAETVGEFVPAAATGPGGLIRKAITQAVIPGLASEAAGEATEGSALEPYARAVGGVAGGAGGALASRAGSAKTAIRAQIPSDLNARHIADADALIQASKAKGIDLTWPEALSHVYESPVLSDTQRILESAPQTRTKMQEFYRDRPQQFDKAALNEFDQIAPGTTTPSQIGPAAGEAATESIGDVRKAINAASEPYYQGAESVLLTPAEMQYVKRIPGYQEARDAVRGSPQLNSYVAHLPDNSVGFLNEVKKYFDQAKENAGSKFNPGKNHQVEAIHGKAAEATKQIGIAKSQDYEIALKIQEQARKQYLDPLLAGPLGRVAKTNETKKAIEALFPSNPLPNSHNEVATAVTALAKKNQWAATQLVRAYAESVFNEATKALQGGANQAGAAKFAVRIVGNPQQRENLRAAIESLPNGVQKWAGFNKFLDAAEASGTRQAIGSKTAFNEEELKKLSASGVTGELARTAGSPGKWLSYIGDKWSRWALGQNLNELATILTDPKSGAILQRIANMPSGSREAQLVAARAVLQAEQAAVNTREPPRK